MNVIEQLIGRINTLETRLSHLERMGRFRHLARYKTQVGQSIPDSAWTTVNYDAMVYDPQSLVTTGAAWKFTAKVAGYYAVSAALQFVSTTTWADGDYASLVVIVNGGLYSMLDHKDNLPGGVSLQMALSGTDLGYLTVGSYVYFQVRQTSGAALNLAPDYTRCWASVWKVD